MTVPSIPIGQAITDPNLLAACLGPNLETWRVWIAVWKAAFGEQLSDTELQDFQRVAGGRSPPNRRVKRFWGVVARRAGKSRMAAAVLVYLALFVDHRSYLARGEVGYILSLRATRARGRLTN